MKWTRKTKILVGVLALLLIIQLFRPERNEGERYTSNDITQTVSVPGPVKSLLEEACYDCHSNYTNRYWYDGIQPLAWWLSDHVEEGKRKLNFSTFKTYTRKRQLHKLKEVVEEIEEGGMPLNSYTWMHKGARLNEEQKTLLVQWAENSRMQLGDSLAAKVPGASE